MSKFRIVLIAVLVLYTGAPVIYAAKPESMSVQVRKGTVRSSPSFLGKVVARLPYGDRVVVVEEKDGWTQVSKKGRKLDGWMHQSALSVKKIILKPGSQDVQKAASDDELALAGKGFNKQVEKEFKTRNPDIDFKGIDRMEKRTVTQRQIRKFLKAGQLSPEGGAQ